MPGIHNMQKSEDLEPEMQMNDAQKIDSAILERSKSVLQARGISYVESNSWKQNLRLILRESAGVYSVWLTITGCYPTALEMKRFISKISIHGLDAAILHLMNERNSDPVNTVLMQRIRFFSPTQEYLMDVTHTATAPYLTGIQRVVREIAKIANPKKVIFFSFSQFNGVLSESKFNWDEVIQKEVIEKSYSSTTYKLMLKTFYRLEKYKLGRRLNTSVRPIAKLFKDKLLRQAQIEELSNLHQEVILNLLIIGKKITLIEIPASIDHINIYENILLEKFAFVQTVVHDFIPFFHTWTVHPGMRGHFNSYSRIIFLSDRIIGNSRLTMEQAKLLIEAFSLERHDWQARVRDFSFLNLPSGLKPAKSGEFSKDNELMVMVGSIEPRKNHLQFLDALEILSRENVPFKARILGSTGWDNDETQRRIHDLATYIDLKQIKADDQELRKWIGSAKVLVQISEAEGFGLPAAEALALGTQVIVSDVRPLNDFQRECVHVVPLGNSIQLASLLKECLKKGNPEKHSGLDSTSWADWSDHLFNS